MPPIRARAQRLAQLVSAEAGLACKVGEGVDSDGDPWYLLQPVGVIEEHAFAVRTTIRWRRIIVSFEPGRFAGDLLSAMGDADATGRSAFREILRECSRRGASIEFRVNDKPCDAGREGTWRDRWTRLSLSLNCRFGPDDNEGEPWFDDALEWSRLFVVAIVALLPVRPAEADEPSSVLGFAEGAASIHRVTRYERDQRNRAAAIAIWGSNCQACELDFATRYGEAAEGLIEVHHTTPVSAMAPGTVVSPAKDLVPLCPNCHSVAHRRDPPYTVQEIRSMLRPDARNTALHGRSQLNQRPVPSSSKA